MACISSSLSPRPSKNTARELPSSAREEKTSHCSIASFRRCLVMAPPERICLQYKDECDCAFDAGFRRARRPRGLKARRFKEGLIAALKRCATQKQQPHQSCGTQKQQVSPLRSRSLASVEMTGGW